jgi:RNA polymerase sigma factor (sigma-70 family)
VTATSLEPVLGQIRKLADIAAAQLSDAQLLERFALLRDEAAFEVLVCRHGPTVLAVARRILHDAHAAEDVFQAAFLVLARKAAVLARRGSVGGWLWTVAYRLALKAKANARRRAANLPPAGSAAADPLTELTGRELCCLLDEELHRLPEKYRLPLLLCCVEGKARDEAAAQLSWTIGQVKAGLERGRELLRCRLERRGLTLSAVLLTAGLGQQAAGARIAMLARPLARVALAFAGGPPPADVSAQVLALVEGMTQGAFALKGKVAAALVLAASLLIGYHFSASGQQPESKTTVPPAGTRSDPPKPADARPQPKGDDHGDPLPVGAIKRLGTLRFRQGGGQVNRLLLSPDGKTLISKSFYGAPFVCVWEFPTGKLLRQLPGHYEENRAVALSPDGKILAVGQGTVIHLYELASGREARQFKGSTGEIQGLAFSPDGKILASGHEGVTVVLWSIASGMELARLPARHNRSTLLAFSPDGKTLATGDTLDKTIRLFDVASRKEQRQFTRPSFVHDFAFSPDGSTLAAGGNDGKVPLWDVASGKLLRELHGPFTFASAVAWAPDGKTLVSSEYDARGSENMCIRFWDPATGKERRHIRGSMGLIRSLLFTSDGKTLISGGGSIIHLWDVATGAERPPVPGQSNVVWWLALSPDGKTLAYSGNEVHLWDLGRAREVGTLPGNHWSFTFSPDGRTLAGGIGRNFINLWDIAGRRLARRLETDLKKDGLSWVAPYKVAFSPDGKLLASGSRDIRPGGLDGAVRLWDLATGKEQRRLLMLDTTGRSHEPEAVAFSPDGRTLAASSRAEPKAGNVRLWDVATGKEQTEISAAINRSVGNLEGRQFSQAPIVSPRIVFSPNGRLLAISSGMKSIPVWEAITGQLRCRLEGHAGATLCVAFAPDGRTLASSGYDSTIRLWDLDTGKELRKLTGHRGDAGTLLFTLDGKTLISGGDDTTILFWDVAALTHRPRPRSAPLARGEHEALWADLASADAARAHRAMVRLATAPSTVPALKERLHPIATVDPKHLARLLRDLDGEEFAVREKASSELAKLGDSVRATLEQALGRPETSLEKQRRLKRLLDALIVPSDEWLRDLRALEVLERRGGADAEQVLQSLARGAPEAQVTREARAALQRLKARSAP